MGLVALWALAMAPEVAHAQKAKLRLERFAFDALPDVKLYLSYVEDDGTVIGGGTVRSFFVNADARSSEWPSETLDLSAGTSIADRMAVHVQRDAVGHVLTQRVDPNLNNEIDIVHGGVAATGLEFAASAAVNDGRADTPLQTASLRVNFMRPFIAGANTRYEGTALRVGRNTAIGDAQAIGDDGKVALTARVTAYR